MIWSYLSAFNDHFHCGLWSFGEPPHFRALEGGRWALWEGLHCTGAGSTFAAEGTKLCRSLGMWTCPVGEGCIRMHFHVGSPTICWPYPIAAHFGNTTYLWNTAEFRFLQLCGLSRIWIEIWESQYVLIICCSERSKSKDVIIVQVWWSGFQIFWSCLYEDICPLPFLFFWVGEIVHLLTSMIRMSMCRCCCGKFLATFIQQRGPLMNSLSWRRRPAWTNEFLSVSVNSCFSYRQEAILKIWD